MNVVHSDDSAEDLHPVEVVHGEDGAALVHEAQKPEAFTFAGVVVANQVNVDLE